MPNARLVTALIILFSVVGCGEDRPAATSRDDDSPEPKARTVDSSSEKAAPAVEAVPERPVTDTPPPVVSRWRSPTEFVEPRGVKDVDGPIDVETAAVLESAALELEEDPAAVVRSSLSVPNTTGTPFWRMVGASFSRAMSTNWNDYGLPFPPSR